MACPGAGALPTTAPHPPASRADTLQLIDVRGHDGPALCPWCLGAASHTLVSHLLSKRERCNKTCLRHPGHTKWWRPLRFFFFFFTPRFFAFFSSFLFFLLARPPDDPPLTSSPTASSKRSPTPSSVHSTPSSFLQSNVQRKSPRRSGHLPCQQQTDSP